MAKKSNLKTYAIIGIFIVGAFLLYRRMQKPKATAAFATIPELQRKQAEAPRGCSSCGS